MSFGDTHEEEYDKEDEENEWLRIVSQAEKSTLFTGMDFSECYCDVCKSEINRNDEHYHCFDCTDFDICIKCHSLGKIHFHGKENFFYRMTEPNWFFPIRILRDEKRTVTSVIMDTFNFFEDRHFVGFRVSEDDEEFTWFRFGQIRDIVLRLAKGMKKDLGLKKGDMIAILCDIRLEPIVIWFSCMYSGITFVPLQNILSVEEKKYILKQTEVKTVFCGEDQVKELKELSRSEDCKSIQSIVVITSNNISHNIIDSKEKDEIIKSSENNNNNNTEKSLPKEIQFSDLIRSDDFNIELSPPPPPVEYKPDDIICIIYTSGTTGFPKGIVFRERTWLSKLTQTNHRKPLVIYSFLPFSHLSGIIDPLLAFFNGGRTALLTQSNMNFLFDDFKILRPTILSTIPRVLNFVYAEYQRRVRASSSETSSEQNIIEEKVKKEMKHIFGDRVPEITVGSAHCSNKVKKMVREICKIPVYDGYGITEVGAVSYNYRTSPDVDIKLLDVPELDYFSTDKPNPRGELLVRNKITQSLEYFKNQEVSRMKFDEDGYFHTGDIVEKRGDRIILIDRKHNIIKLAQGEFVSLENIEKVLETSNYIDQVVLSANKEKTHLLGLVTVQPSHWEDLRSKTKESSSMAEEIVMKDIEGTGKRNGMNSWEFPVSIRLIYDSFPLTELKKKSRKKILEKYEGLLKEMFLYTKSREENNENGIIESSSTHDIEELMKNLGIRIEVEEVRRKTLRELGVKSFTGIVLRNQIEQIVGVKLSFSELMTRSISQILEFLKDKKTGVGSTLAKIVPPEYINLEEEEEKFKQYMDEIRKLNPVPKTLEGEMGIWINNPRSILVTGTTGFLGQCLLEKILLEYPKSTIICLVRRSSSSSSDFLNNYGDNGKRIVLLYGDLSQPYLGLGSEEKFKEGVMMEGENEIDIIVHCGAMVNHFADYGEHYEANVRSLYDLVRISRGFKPFVYVSSVSVFRSYMSRIMTGDEALENQDFPFADGYSGSKWVSDCLVRKFVESSFVIRPNLIIGDTRDGRCNLKDWISAIIYSCLDTKSVPDSGTTLKVPLNMLPVNFLTNSIVLMMKDIQMYGKGGKNISFSNATVGELMDLIYEVIGKRKKSENMMKKVSWSEWINQLEGKVGEKTGIHPISPFLEGFIRSGRIGGAKFLELDTSNYTREYRKEWKKANRDDVEKYVEYISTKLLM